MIVYLYSIANTTSTVRAQRDVVRPVQQDLARRAVHRRHRPLAENPQVLFRQPKPVVLGQEVLGFTVRGRAGHQIQRNPRPVATRGRNELLKMDLKERIFRDRTDWVHALGMVKPQPGALPAGHQHHTHVAGAERLDALGAGLLGREAVGR